MKLKIISSGSKGNCYLLVHNNRTLILDVGVAYKDIIRGLNFDLTSMDGIVVTHNHKDHSKSVKDFEKAGFDVWKPYTEDKKIQTRKFGIFKVTCFPVPHDDVECRGFLIDCDGEKLLYATDFEYIKYSFKANMINHVLIECNYIPELIKDDASNRDHVLKGHASVNVTRDIVNDLKTDCLRTVILCHLSENNCDKELVVKEVEKAFMGPIYVAEKSVEINL